MIWIVNIKTHSFLYPSHNHLIVHCCRCVCFCYSLLTKFGWSKNILVIFIHSSVNQWCNSSRRTNIITTTTNGLSKWFWHALEWWYYIMMNNDDSDNIVWYYVQTNSCRTSFNSIGVVERKKHFKSCQRWCRFVR